MLQRELPRSSRAGLRRSHNPLQIGGAINVCPLIEQEYSDAVRPRCVQRLGKYVVRTPVDPPKERRMGPTHPNKVVAAIRSRTNHHAITRGIEGGKCLSNQSRGKIGQIGRDHDDRRDAQPKHIFEYVAQTPAELAASLPDDIDVSTRESAQACTLARRLARDNALRLWH